MIAKLRHALMILLGAFLIYAASYVIADEIWPQVRESGWSLAGTSMILNHKWKGNELYVLVGAYIVLGSGLVIGGVRAWKHRRAGEITTSRETTCCNLTSTRG